jgi:diacylglycerol kinase family enzyme
MEQAEGWGKTAWFETTKEDPGQGPAREALATGPAVLIVAGGDGTVRAVAEAASEGEVPMAIVPFGTGNLLSRNLELPRGDVDASIAVAFTGANRRIDIGFCELEREDRTRSRHAFTVMAGFGLDAHMAANTNSTAKKHIGWLAYSAPIAKSVVGNKRVRLHYRLDDGRTKSVRAHTVIVGNCGSLTAGMLLLPDAAVDDGLLDMVMLRPDGIGGWTMISARVSSNQMLYRTRFGRLIARLLARGKSMQHATAREIQMRFNEPQLIEIDGDDFGAVTRLRITVRESGLLLRVPTPAT